MRWLMIFAVLTAILSQRSLLIAADIEQFLRTHCIDCHGSKSPEGNFNLVGLTRRMTHAETINKWVKVYDRIESEEMPPKGEPRPPRNETTAVLKSLKQHIVKAERSRSEPAGVAPLRRLTRAEYEQTLRDLFDLPALAVQRMLPVDGSAHGFDKHGDALEMSHVNLAKYLEAAEHTLDLAIATQPKPPEVQSRRISLANSNGYVLHALMDGGAVLLKNKKPDPDFPPADARSHIHVSSHERLGMFNNGSSVGLFAHESVTFFPRFIDHVTIYPGNYRIRTSLWSFLWNKGRVEPARGIEAARLSIVQLSSSNLAGEHPTRLLGYFDAPSIRSKEYELVTWLNHNELISFNAASLAPVTNLKHRDPALAFTGPGIACDWLDIQGPLHDVWPPRSHTVLFGDLPLVEFSPGDSADLRPPNRKSVPHFAGKNRPDPPSGVWTVHSAAPLVDADRLLASFLPKAFRHPVADTVRKDYVAQVAQRLQQGDCFETAMKWAFRAALCAPDFLYHIEDADDAGMLDDRALANRLSYFLWNSSPDDSLTALAGEGTLHSSETLTAEIERMLNDSKSQRFIEDFLGQWLKLREIAATDPDQKLYPEFSTYLQDSMVAESHAYFREMIERDLSAKYLVRSDFAMLNEKLATHYNIPEVSGSQIRRVELPWYVPRGSFLTQGSVLKVTANGTTTSPVPRGAFIMSRLIGEPPDPPPADVPAIEPDVRGARTIRDQLDRHRSDPTCASCHAKFDPVGFALESFDVVGGFRTRYRSLGNGDPAPRGSIDPYIPIYFKLGPPVDPSGALPDQQKFAHVIELQKLLAADSQKLLKNLAKQFVIYSTGRNLTFADRDALAEIVSHTEQQGGGVRTLIRQVILSPLFLRK